MKCRITIFAKIKQIFEIEMHRNLKISTCDPFIYKMGNYILIQSSSVAPFSLEA